MSEYVTPLAELIECFRRLPGVGAKSAVRMAFGVLEMSGEDAEEFCRCIRSVKNDVKYCSCCCNYSQDELCEICSDPKRDRTTICVVEDARAVTAFEKTHGYNGLYHVLGGVISPVDGIGPEQLKIKELMSRLTDEGIEEIIIATNPNIEGETTAIYLSRLIKPLSIKVSRLAYGVPVGADLEFADGETLTRAIQGRREL